MKKIIAAAALAALGTTATSSDTRAEVNASVCANGVCKPVDPVTAAVAIGVGVATSIEKNCREDKESSCTEEAKKAGQNVVDILRGKKNGFKSAARALKRIFKF